MSCIVHPPVHGNPPGPTTLAFLGPSDHLGKHLGGRRPEPTGRHRPAACIATGSSTLLASATAGPAGCNHDGEVQLVIEREPALLSFLVRRSAHQFNDILDPEFREIGASGRLWTRAQMMAALAEDPYDGGGAIAATQMAGAFVGPDLVLLTYVSNWQGRRARRSSQWRRSVAISDHEQRDLAPWFTQVKSSRSPSARRTTLNRV